MISSVSFSRLVRVGALGIFTIHTNDDALARDVANHHDTEENWVNADVST
jgi:hypothetical protein